MMQTNLLHRFFLFCLLISGIASPGFAQTKIAGRDVTFDTDWIAPDSGYYRLKVSLSTVPAVPAPVTEEYSVVITKRDYSQEYLTVAKPLILESGQTTAETEIYLPSSGGQSWENRFRIHIENNGNMKLDRYDLCHTDVNLAYQQSSQMPTMLFISSAVSTPKSHTIFVSNRGKRRPGRNVNLKVDTKIFPQISSLQQFYPEPQMDWSNNVPVPKTNPTTLDALESDRIHAISPNDVPENWLGLSAADIIFVSFDDLKAIEANSPKRMDAIRKWTTVGGTLVVNNCGDQFKEANKVRSMVTEQPRALAQKRTPWYVPRKKLSNIASVIDDENLVNSSNGSYVNGDYIFRNPEELVKIADEKALNKIAKENENGVAFCDYLHGRLVVTGNDMLAWDVSDWALLLNTISQKQNLTRNQIGSVTELRQPNVDFAIPGVGSPPVNLFQILITMFLLVVGPISYALLKRKQRLQLLFATAPLFSLLACLALVTYAVISDGFQVRGRVSSISSIDHVSGKSVTFTRHAHYSGITPRPYEFKSDQFVVNEQSYGSPKSIYVQTNEKTEVFGGEIQPRTPHQLAVIQADETEAGLQLLISAEGLPTVTNNFGHTVRLAYFVVGDTFYRIRELEPGQAQAGEKIPKKDAQVKKIVQELSPKIDYGDYVPSNQNNRFYYYRSGNQQTFGTGLGDRTLNELQRGNFRSFLKGDRTYLAILEDSDLSHTPQENIDYKLKMHVVGGKW